MVDELTVNRTRCFAHILNLIAKSILRLFNVEPPKKKKKKEKDDVTGNGDEDEDADDAGTAGDADDEPGPELSAEEQELLDLAGDIEEEELTARYTNQVDNDEVEDDDDDDGWVDEVAEMTAGGRAALKDSIRPVSRVLVKVRIQTHLEYTLTILHSSEK